MNYIEVLLRCNLEYNRDVNNTPKLIFCWCNCELEYDYYRCRVCEKYKEGSLGIKWVLNYC